MCVIELGGMLSKHLRHPLLMCCCVEGIMSGSPCPAEIVTKLKTVMNMKEITVSGYMS